MHSVYIRPIIYTKYVSSKCQHYFSKSYFFNLLKQQPSNNVYNCDSEKW